MQSSALSLRLTKHDCSVLQFLDNREFLKLSIFTEIGGQSEIVAVLVCIMIIFASSHMGRWRRLVFFGSSHRTFFACAAKEFCRDPETLSRCIDC